MDRHEWKHKGMQCYVADEGSRVALAVPYTDPVNRENAAAAEILRLAEESEARRVYIEDFEKQAVATGEENQRLRAERDALKLTAEEGQEIIGELSMALAILAGESLVSCGEDICGDDVQTCRGHLGQRAREVVRHSLATYRALLEGNRLAATARLEAERDRDAALEALRGTQKQVRHLEADLAIARSRVEQAERRNDDLLDAEAAIQAAIDEGNEADARIGRELVGVLMAHCRERAESGGAVQALRRIIRERAVYLRQVQTADTLLCRCRNIYEHRAMGEHHFPSGEIADFLRDARTHVPPVAPEG